MGGRGLLVDHSTINRRVIYYSPLLVDEFRKNSKRKVDSSWRMDETYIKLKGVWHYLYRAVDKAGDTVVFRLSIKRDKPAAKAFFDRAIGSNGLPEKVMINKSAANKAGIDAINLEWIIFYLSEFELMQITVRQIKYLNNSIKQDHRSIKRITHPMIGFKHFIVLKQPLQVLSYITC